MIQPDAPFYWAVLIEDTFIPHTRPGLRPLEEYELTQHYQFWRQDLDCAASLGLTHLRWGIPWYRVNPAPGQFDWRWVDEVLDYMVSVKGIRLIADLLHYGTPLWMADAFVDPDYPQRMAEYAYAFATRYAGLVDWYTPHNEPTITAEYCGRRALWPPYLDGDAGYVKVLLGLTRGTLLTAEALRAAQPSAVLVQVEALGWEWTADPRVQPHVDDNHMQRYLAFDLSIGRVDDAHPGWPWLREHGVTAADLAWVRDRAMTVDVLGANVYPWSGGELVLGDDGQVRRACPLSGAHLAEVLRSAWVQYRIPLLVTETGAHEDVAGRARWMDDTIAAVRAVQAEGVPVLGYTWFPLFTFVDWEYRTGRGPLTDYLWHMGLWDAEPDAAGIMQRRENSLAEHYRQYIQGRR